MTAPSTDWPEVRWPAGVGLKALETTDSTNEEARRLAEAGEPSPIWIWAREQTAGRGRRARAWKSGADDLTATLLLRPSALRPTARPGESATLSYAAALALSDALAMIAPTANTRLKWPNDVLADGRKIAGILLEGRSDPRFGDWVAIGIGLNIATAPNAQEVEAGAWESTALARYLSAPPAPDDALRLLAAAFQRRLQDWALDGFAALRTDWLSRAARLGETVEARLGASSVTGRFVDVDADGALVLETPNGVRRISAADVYFP